MRVLTVLALIAALALQAQTPSATPSQSPNAAPSVDTFCAGCNYGGANLAHANFAGGDYVGANFQAADLSGANFTGAKLVGVNFFNADLRGAAFNNAECTACNFLGAKLDGATFTGVRMVAGNFNGFDAKLDGAQLRALLSGCMVCNFADANIAGYNLAGASLIQVDLSGADLSRTNFTAAALCRYQNDSTGHSVVCNHMQGAKTDGAIFTDIQVCANPLAHTGCSPVDAATFHRAFVPSPSPSPSPR
jgi:uncharacterized protein YjbI with pentapeptide repeats